MNTLDSGLKQLLKIEVTPLFNLATKLREGVGIPKDFRKAARLYGLAALREDSRAQYCLGEMALRGEGCEASLVKALMWFNLAAGQGEPGALSNAVSIAKQLSANENKDAKGQIAYFFEAKKLFQIAQHGKDPKAMNDLGVMYSAGRGLGQDIDLAIAWFHSAMAQDYSEAYFNLGFAYETGQGLEQNLPEAVNMYELAASKGSSNAQYYLARLIERDGSRKPSEAITLYESAAVQGHLLAQLKLAEYFKSLDDPDALLDKKFKRSSVLEDTESNQLNVKHKNKNRKNSPNMLNAYKYYSMAAAQDDSNSQCQVGLMAAQGLGTEQDFEQAAHWFELAAKQGNAQAQFNLGFLYSHGQGVDEDFVEAYKWYRVSDHCGYTHARQSLQLIEKKMNPGQIEMAIWKSENFIYANIKNPD